jgi:ring-1,2-phenylacetyl-CoA epoxidase subunit PaaD
MVEAWDVLRGIPDPEIPVISIVELGIVREVKVDGRRVEVAITPTYSGCPALHAIEEDIAARLHESGYSEVTVKQQLSPAWTTDWIAGPARDRLREYGIAPPHPVRGADAHRIHLFSRAIACPQCGSENSERLSEFGSTACKALYRCIECREPFDYFKPL